MVLLVLLVLPLVLLVPTVLLDSVCCLPAWPCYVGRSRRIAVDRFGVQ